MRQIILFFLALFPAMLPAQDLLMNGGFEEENICKEYDKNCAPEGWISTSLFADYYFEDATNAYEGGHFIGLISGRLDGPVARHFLRSRLLCGLRKGAQYQLNLHIRSNHPVFDSIGVYFSSHDFLYQKDKLRNTIPQIWVRQDSGLQAVKGWQSVSLLYTASGDENYLSIGDFKKQEHVLTGRPDLGKDYYFFIDSMSLAPVNPQEHLCSEWAMVKEQEYNFDVRHNLLDRLVYAYTKKPPVVEPLAKTIVQRIDTLVIPDVLFATNSYSVSEKAKTLLDAFTNRTEAYQVDSVVVEGHTDSVGSDFANQKLSENRAAAVAEYVKPSIDATVQTRGWASQKPIADNRTNMGRQKNRRVEIYLYIRE